MSVIFCSDEDRLQILCGFSPLHCASTQVLSPLVTYLTSSLIGYLGSASRCTRGQLLTPQTDTQIHTRMVFGFHCTVYYYLSLTVYRHTLNCIRDQTIQTSGRHCSCLSPVPAAMHGMGIWFSLVSLT